MENYEKLYKEALKRAKEFRDKDNVEVAEYIFPELAVSEDERIRKDCIKYLDWEYQHCPIDEDKIKIEKCIAWLEKQSHDGKKWIYEDVYIKEKEQLIQDGIDEVLENPQKYGLEKQGEQKSAWSEKDKQILNAAILHLKNETHNYYGVYSSEYIIRWLKSLRPQTTWKPSDEQMGVIEAVINNRSFQRRHLDSLFAQLKKLREE